MAWIESHQELRNHPKTKRLARKLQISPAAATGHLHFLWWWAIDYAPDGDLTEFDDWEIADAAGYECDDPTQFKDALIFAGFLDNTEQGTLIIHDRNDYAGKSLKQREQARKRTQRYREKQSANVTEQTRNADETPTEPVQNEGETDTTRNSDGNVTHTQRIHNANDTDTTRNGDASTVHDRTVHDITGQDSTVQDTTNTLPPTPTGGESPPGKPPDIQQERFAEFWKIYPKKRSKGSAEKAWKKIKPDKELHEKILAAVRDNIARNHNWQKDNGQFIPYPASWLNAKGWEDSLEETQMGGGQCAGRNARANPGADNYSGFQRSTGFRRADTEPDTDT